MWKLGVAYVLLYILLHNHFSEFNHKTHIFLNSHNCFGYGFKHVGLLHTLVANKSLAICSNIISDMIICKTGLRTNLKSK